MRKVVALFGAGYLGERALQEKKEWRVVCFIDNDIEKTGKMIDDIPIITLDDYLRIYGETKQTKIVITSVYIRQISKQLEDNGITDYEIYHSVRGGYYLSNQLIINPYEKRWKDVSEQEYIEHTEKNIPIDYINHYVDCIRGQNALFSHIEIETLNRCNGVCEFCPVSVKNEERVFKTMSETLFKKIIDELAEYDYSGRICLFSNNEPFLDERIIDFHKYTREKLPNARIHIFTNGTVLTIEKFKEVVPYIDEFVIDNYNQELKLISNVKDIADYCDKYESLKKKVTIVLRKPKEILTTRGGEAPNRECVRVLAGVKCILPFQQMIVRPDGKVSLCCNDPLGKFTMGDVNEESLKEIWFGDSFNRVREKLANGRENLIPCKKCDVFSLG